MQLSRFLLARLGAMMFLEFFVWGTWFATLGLVLTRHGLGGAIGDAYSAGPAAAIISPFLLGLLVDRFISSHRALSVLHLIGAGVLWSIPAQIAAAQPAIVLTLLFAYLLCYMPTLALVNNVAFHALGSQRTRFPLIRVFGTVGWVVAGVLIGQAGLSDSVTLFRIAAAGSLILGVYSLSLPATPPPRAGRPFSLRDLLFRDAVKLFKRPNFLVFAVCAALICIPLAAYYAYASPFLGALEFSNVATVMALGQVSEVGCMLLVPVFLSRFGIKSTLLIGMLAWGLRYALFATAASGFARPFILGAILLHGICYDFFFVVAFMYADSAAGDEVKGQAQGLVVMLTYGAGMLLGSQLCGALYGAIATTHANLAVSKWQVFWWMPAAIALAVFVLFAIFFKPEGLDPSSSRLAR